LNFLACQARDADCFSAAGTVDFVACALGGAPRLGRKILCMTGVQDGARRIDHQPGSTGGLSSFDARFDIAALHANAGHQQRQIADDRAHAGELVGKRRANDESKLPIA